MSFGISATTALVVGGSILGGAAIAGANSRQAASQAADAQIKAAELQAASSQRQFDAIQKELDPYKQVGLPALSALQDFQGLNGRDAYQNRVNTLVTPEVQFLQQQGEESILRNAAATGGLRGGNTQAALAQYSPALIQQLIQQRIAGLGGLVGIGQNAASGQISNLSAFGANERGAFGNIGSANANRFQAIGAANNILPNAIGNLGASYFASALQPRNAGGLQAASSYTPQATYGGGTNPYALNGQLPNAY